MSAELLEILMRAWFYGGGSYLLLVDLLTLMNKDEISVDDILPFVGGICAGEKDASILYLLAKGACKWEKQPDTFTYRIGEAAADAIKQRKILFAWTLLRCRWETDAWDVLLAAAPESKATLELLQSQKFVWEGRAAALLLVCKHNAAMPRYHVDKGLLEKWSALEGRRERREFKTRPEACLFVTKRGEMNRNITNIEEIREPLTALHGSPYWDTIAAEFGGWKPIYKNAASKEAFYDLYFPDDIPDEWSAADQEKSHGRGFFTDTEKERILMNLHGTAPSLGLVSWTHDAIRCGLDLSLYEIREGWADIEKGWNLTPRLKKIVLVK